MLLHRACRRSLSWCNDEVGGPFLGALVLLAHCVEASKLQSLADMRKPKPQPKASFQVRVISGELVYRNALRCGYSLRYLHIWKLGWAIGTLNPLNRKPRCQLYSPNPRPQSLNPGPENLQTYTSVSSKPQKWADRSGRAPRRNPSCWTFASLPSLNPRPCSNVSGRVQP